MTAPQTTPTRTGSPELDVLLALAGIQPRPDDHAAMVAAFGQVRAQTELLYGVTAARYERPALQFSADV